MVEDKRLRAGGSIFLRSHCARLLCHGWLCIKHLNDALSRSRGTREDHDEVGDIDHRLQRLDHVVHEGDDLALAHETRVDLPAACPQDRDNAEVHHQKRRRRKPSGQVAYRDGSVRLVDGNLMEACLLGVLTAEGADHASA